MKRALIGLIALVAALGIQAVPASAAVGISVQTYTRDVTDVNGQEVRYLEGKVSAAASTPTDCPNGPNDGSPVDERWDAGIRPNCDLPPLTVPVP